MQVPLPFFINAIARTPFPRGLSPNLCGCLLTMVKSIRYRATVTGCRRVKVGLPHLCGKTKCGTSCPSYSQKEATLHNSTTYWSFSSTLDVTFYTACRC